MMAELRFEKSWRATGQGVVVVYDPDAAKNEADHSICCDTLPGEVPLAYCNSVAIAHMAAAAPDMFEAITQFLPKNFEFENSNFPEDALIPLDVEYGELRALYRALKKARGEV